MDLTGDHEPPNEESSDELFRLALRMLAARALDDEDPLTRKHAIYLLGLARNPDCSDTFVKALSDPEKAVRAQATHALTAIGEPVSDRLIRLLNEPDWKVRYRAAEALGMMKEKKAVRSLIDHLTDEKDHVRYMALKSLGEIDATDAIERIELLLNDENPYVRRMAASVLGGLGERLS